MLCLLRASSWAIDSGKECLAYKTYNQATNGAQYAGQEGTIIAEYLST